MQWDGQTGSSEEVRGSSNTVVLLHTFMEEGGAVLR